MLWFEQMFAGGSPVQLDGPVEELLVRLNVFLQALHERSIALVVHEQGMAEVAIHRSQELLVDVGTDLPTLVETEIHDVSLHLVADDQDVLDLQEYHVVVLVHFLLDGLLKRPQSGVDAGHAVGDLVLQLLLQQILDPLQLLLAVELAVLGPCVHLRDVLVVAEDVGRHDV